MAGKRKRPTHGNRRGVGWEMVNWMYVHAPGKTCPNQEGFGFDRG
jgi:hypothetical protein